MYAMSNYYYNTTRRQKELYPKYDNMESKVFLEILTVAAMISFLVNLFIILATLRNQKLRLNNYNRIMAHYLGINTVYMLIIPVSMRIDLYTYIFHYNYFYACITDDIKFTLMFSNILFVLLLAVFWYTSLYSTNVFVKLSGKLKMFIAGIYLFCGFWLCLHVESCFSHRFLSMSAIILLFSYVVSCGILLVINVLHLCKKSVVVVNYRMEDGKVLYLVNMFLFPALPFLVALMSGLSITIVYAMLMFVIANPVYTVFILYRFDKDYRELFRYYLTCRFCRRREQINTSEPVVLFRSSTYV